MPRASGFEGILAFSLFGTRIARTLAWRSCGALVLAVAAFCISRETVAAPVVEERALSLHNIHTKEDISIVYKRGGAFVPEALEKLNYFMRDWRRNVTIKIDPQLYDIIWQLHGELGSKQPINLICGHRSAATNEGLRRARGGQARGSLHIKGQAADIQFPDISIKQLRNSALIMERGGVGYYPSSSIPFVHVDTGKVRHWPRLPRMELAILFPAGHSQHVPADGRPITRGDFRIALAQLHERGGELPLALQRRMQPGTPSTVLASLTPNAEQAAITPSVEAKSKPQVVLASLTPSFGRARPDTQPSPAKLAAPQPTEARPIIEARTVPTSARPDASLFTRDLLDNQPAAKAQDAADEPEYDEDEMADDQETQPYPALPFMSDTPIASMDMSGPNEMSLSKVHLLFGETREMLHEQFQPGLQIAQFYFAQSFRGTAVNTVALRRVERDGHQPPLKTANR